MHSKLIIGCGYVGFPVAKRWVSNGDQVFAITRRPEFAIELERAGIRPIIWNWYSPWPTNDGLLDEVREQLSTILISVSHATVPDRSADRTHVDGLNHLLAAFSGDVGSHKWVYLSTTGVFGSGSSGDWLDEDSEVSPVRPGSVAAQAGEHWIREHVCAANRLILRPSGIYGPQRVPNWRAIRDRVPLAMHPESYVNLIHLDDLVYAIDELSSKQTAFDLYCISDGNPPTRKEYYEYISELGNYAKPIFAPESSASNSRSESNKRISSRRLLQELGKPLSFPTYREGIASLLHELS